MSAGMSPEQISTLAMMLLKQNAVQSIDDNTIEAENCKIWYTPCLNELLENYAFTFSTIRRQLQQSATTPVFQYLYSYPLPEDCAMPLEARADITTDSDGTTNPSISYPPGAGIPFTWVVEGPNIVTNADIVYLKYSSYNVQPGQFSSAFCMSLAYRMASNLAYVFTGNEKLAATLLQASDAKVRQAQSRDAQIGTQEEFVQQDSWVASRNSTRLWYRNGLWQRQGWTE